MGSLPDKNSRLNTEVVSPLKYMSKFWWSVDLPLINCEIELYFSWSKSCLISEIKIAAVVAVNLGENPPVQATEAALTTRAKFQINNAKTYVPVFTLSVNDTIKCLEYIKQEYEKKCLGINIDLQ